MIINLPVQKASVVILPPALPLYKLYNDLDICSLRSVGTFARKINAGRLKELFSLKKGAGRRAFFTLSDKENYKDQICAILDTESFHSVADVVKMLKERFGLTPSVDAASVYAEELGVQVA